MKKLIAIVLIWCLCGALAYGISYGYYYGSTMEVRREYHASKSECRRQLLIGKGGSFACFCLGPIGLAMAICQSGLGHYDLRYSFFEEEEIP